MQKTLLSDNIHFKHYLMLSNLFFDVMITTGT